MSTNDSASILNHLIPLQKNWHALFNCFCTLPYIPPRSRFGGYRDIRVEWSAPNYFGLRVFENYCHSQLSAFIDFPAFRGIDLKFPFAADVRFDFEVG